MIKIKKKICSCWLGTDRLGETFLALSDVKVWFCWATIVTLSEELTAARKDTEVSCKHNTFIPSLRVECKNDASNIRGLVTNLYQDFAIIMHKLALLQQSQFHILLIYIDL